MANVDPGWHGNVIHINGDEARAEDFAARKRHPTEADYQRKDRMSGRFIRLVREWEALCERGAPPDKIAAAWARVEAQRPKVEAAYAAFNARFPPRVV